MFSVISINELERMIKAGEDLVFIDLRRAGEYEAFHFPGAVNIPYQLLNQERLMPYRGSLLVFGCEHGGKSMRAARDLNRRGFRTASLGCGNTTRKPD